MIGLFGIDTYIAFGLIAIAVIIFFISRIGILPRKSLPFLAAALAGVFGVILFQKWRSDKALQALKEKEEELKKREKILEDLKNTAGASEEKLEEVKAEFDRHRAAHEKETLLIREENKEEKEQIDGLSGEELHDAFRKAFPPG